MRGRACWAGVAVCESVAVCRGQAFRKGLALEPAPRERPGPGCRAPGWPAADRAIAAPPPAATEARELIARLGLQPHPEGGWYRELHRSETTVQRHGDGRHRAGLTLIAYLLCRGERSRWHRVRDADEIWHHGAGAPLDLWCLPPEGGTARLLGLGALTDSDGRMPKDCAGDGPGASGLDAERPAAAEPGAEALIEGDPSRSDPGDGDPAGDVVAEAGELQRGPGGGATGADEAGCRAAEGDAPVRVIAAHWWQEARSRGEWSLVYCTGGARLQL